TRGDDNVLPAVLAHEGHRRRAAGGFELRVPELLPRLRIEGSEPRILRRADEHEPARRRDGTAEVGRLRRRNPLRDQLWIDPEWNLPRDVAGVGVDRHQFAPRRLLTRIPV